MQTPGAAWASGEEARSEQARFQRGTRTLRKRGALLNEDPQSGLGADWEERDRAAERAAALRIPEIVAQAPLRKINPGRSTVGHF